MRTACLLILVTLLYYNKVDKIIKYISKNKQSYTKGGAVQRGLLCTRSVSQLHSLQSSQPTDPRNTHAKFRNARAAFVM